MTAHEPKLLKQAPGDGREPIPKALANSPDYEVVREINRGGMGVVYLVRNRRMDRLEALKVVKPAILERGGGMERFEREMRSAARLNHLHIVTAYSSPPLEGLLALAMEYVDGTDLQQLVRTRGPLPVAKACYYVHQAALGLQHAADRQMVHRDIKPANLILTRDGKRQVIKILDFGLAKATSENPVEGGLTGEGQVLGTPLYMAPEQIRNAAAADIRADIYSLGCTLYYLLVGLPPFHDKSGLYEILLAHQQEQPRPVMEVRPDVPRELAEIVARMTAKDPAERYQQPLEVAQALSPFFKQTSHATPGEPIAPDGPAHANAMQTSPISKPATVSCAPIRKTSDPFAWPINRQALTLWAGIGVLLCGAWGLWASGYLWTGSNRESPAANPQDARGPEERPLLVKPDVSSGFLSVFNGQDLTGWKVNRDDYASWRVENGEIAVSCAGWKSASVLYSEKKYANYRFRMEYKVDPGARCKLVARYAEGDTHVSGEPHQAGLVVIDDAYAAVHPEIRGPRHTGTLVVSRDFKNAVPVDEPGEVQPAGMWNLLEVEVRAQTLSCAVNGKPVLQTHLDELAARENAFAGLRQTYAPVGLEGTAGTVRFRNIAIEELPPTPSSQSRSPEGEFSSLFNGQDLSGWKAVDIGKKGLSARWRVANGAIAASAPLEDKHPPLFLSSAREFSDFVLRFEFRKTREPARCNLVYHAAERVRHHVVLVHETEPQETLPGAIRYASGKIRFPLDHAPLNGLDQWNQAELEGRQGQVRVVINGVEVQNCPARPGEKSDLEAGHPKKPARLGFTVMEGGMEFRKIEILTRQTETLSAE